MELYENTYNPYNSNDDFNSPLSLRNSFESENSLNLLSSEDTNNIFSNSNISSQSINNEINIINIPQPQQRKKMGRKKQNSGEEGEHDKYSEDNLIRRSKKLFKDAFAELINSEIKQLDFKLFITIDNKKYRVINLLNLGQT